MTIQCPQFSTCRLNLRWFKFETAFYMSSWNTLNVIFSIIFGPLLQSEESFIKVFFKNYIFVFTWHVPEWYETVLRLSNAYSIDSMLYLIRISNANRHCCILRLKFIVLNVYLTVAAMRSFSTWSAINTLQHICSKTCKLIEEADIVITSCLSRWCSRLKTFPTDPVSGLVLDFFSQSYW